MHIYDFPLPLDYISAPKPQSALTIKSSSCRKCKSPEHSFIKHMHSEYARLLYPVVSQVVRETPHVSSPIHEHLDRESLAQMTDRVMLLANLDEAILSDTAEQALARALLLMEMHIL